MIKPKSLRSTFFSTLPVLVLSNSIKSAELGAVSNFLTNVSVILNLSAPGAEKFVLPIALSYKLASSSAVTILSSTLRPTLYDGFVPYWSKIIVCSATLTKYPLAKNTPAPTLAVEPVDKASELSNCASGVPDAIVVDKYVISSSQTKVSPRENVLVTLSSAFCK